MCYFDDEVNVEDLPTPFLLFQHLWTGVDAQRVSFSQAFPPNTQSFMNDL